MDGAEHSLGGAWQIRVIPTLMGGPVANAEATDLLGHSHAGMISLSRSHLSILGPTGRLKKKKESKSSTIQLPVGVQTVGCRVERPGAFQTLVSWVHEPAQASAFPCHVGFQS